MRKFTPFLLAYFTASLLWASDPIKDLEKRVTEHTLKNGMKILILERHGSPLVSFEMMFRAGGIDDMSGKTGLAHLFEHMMFKGSKTVGTKDYRAEKPLIEAIDRVATQIRDEEFKGPKADPEKIKAMKKKMEALEAKEQKLIIPSEFDQIYEREGGEGLNAFTAKDMTGFVVSLPSNKWELWPILESDRMVNPVLREFYKERDVVMEERRMRYENDPEGKIWENLMAIAFVAHPYNMPTIGWMSDVRTLTQDDAASFFKAHYGPNNAAVAIVGDVAAPEVMGKLDLYFANVSSQPLSFNHITEEPEQTGERRVVVHYDSEPELLIAFHKPNAPDPDNFAMEMIEEVLNRGRTSLFFKNIVERGIAISAGASNGTPGERYPNLIVLSGSPRKPFTNSDLEKAILAELERLKKEKISSHDLEKIRNQIEADFIRKLDSNSGMASELAYNQTVLGDWRYLFSYLEGIRRVTPEDILRTAQTYFKESNRTVAYLQREK